MNAELGMRNSKCGMQNAEWGIKKNKCRMENENPKSEFGAESVGLNMVQGDLKNRTKRFALEIIKVTESLPKGRTAEIVARQLLRAGTSAGANYRSACRARSTADFISKMGIVEEELDESSYWMELLVESEILKPATVESLLKETDELLSITVASINTAKRRTK